MTRYKLNLNDTIANAIVFARSLADLLMIHGELGEDYSPIKIDDSSRSL